MPFGFLSGATQPFRQVPIAVAAALLAAPSASASTRELAHQASH